MTKIETYILTGKTLFSAEPGEITIDNGRVTVARSESGEELVDWPLDSTRVDHLHTVTTIGSTASEDPIRVQFTDPVPQARIAGATLLAIVALAIVVDVTALALGLAILGVQPWAVRRERNSEDRKRFYAEMRAGSPHLEVTDSLDRFMVAEEGPGSEEGTK